MNTDIEDLIGFPLPANEPFENWASRRRELGPLHDLLLGVCPREPDGVASIPKLARLIGVSAAAIYRWIDKNEVPGKRARQMTELEGARKALVDFLPYL